MTRNYSQRRYLAAKRTVDDRALNAHVLDAVTPALRSASRIVEVGAGIGTMVERLLGRDLLGDDVTYTLVDVDADALAVAAERIPDRAASLGYTAVGTDGDDAPTDASGETAATDPRHAVELHDGDRTVRVETVVADATAYLTGAVSDGEVDSGADSVPGATPTPDVLVGCAFLDLLCAPAADDLFATLPDGCVCYFPITFDGGTWFGPEVDPDFDDRVVERYHEDMRRRDDPGDPHAGRRVLARATADHDLLAAGASDWVVAPAADGGYPADEAYFLHHIVDTVDRALADDPRLNGPRLDNDRLAAWTERRHEAIEAGELVYVAHQLDVALRV